jgi:hypothetical protein
MLWDFIRDLFPSGVVHDVYFASDLLKFCLTCFVNAAYCPTISEVLLSYGYFR